MPAQCTRFQTIDLGMRLRPIAVLVCIVCLGGWAAQTTTPKPLTLTAPDLQKLRWIEGSWRGTGGGVPPFYERYRFENPTTLIVETLENDKVKDASRFCLLYTSPSPRDS